MHTPVNQFVVLYDAPTQVESVHLSVQDGSGTYAIGFAPGQHGHVQLTRDGDNCTVTGTAEEMYDETLQKRIGGPADFKLEMNCTGSW
ncbi:MAG: hypothetical protein QOH57_4140 [Mycobacterium sp.]|jgi:hypothetical protein|nr:hypothetical protein [Mycobacterium sp.]